MRVHCTILKSPKEAHDPNDRSVIEHNVKGNCYTCHCQNDAYIHDHRESTPKFINEEANEETPQDFSKAKANHRKD